LKYNIIITEGCTAFDFSVNGKSVSEFSNEEHSQLVDHLLLKIKEEIAEQTILLQDIVRLFQPDDWKSDTNPCEQCSDYLRSTTWNV
jgi:hypothetical protein